jgi:hypothetical protein
MSLKKYCNHTMFTTLSKVILEEISLKKKGSVLDKY